MKYTKYILMSALLISTSFLNAQSMQDTKDYVKELVDNNTPLSNYQNALFFKENIVKSDADDIAGKNLSYEEYNNIIIYMREVFYEGRKGWLWSVGETADLRDFDKIMIRKSQNKDKYAYYIVVYLKGKYHKKKYNHVKGSPKEYKPLDKIEILIGDDYETAKKIKKALIHLGKLSGSEVRDGDLF